MHKYSTLPSLRWTVFVVILCTASGSAFADDADAWVAAEASGSVGQSGTDGSWHPVVSGDALVDGAHVRTGSDGKLVLSHHQDTVTVSPNSEFALPRGGEAAMGPNVLQQLGTLLFRVEHTPGRHFEVDAPYLAAVVKGTVFTVSAGASGNSVHVAEGAVEVTARLTRDVALIRPGQTAVVPPSGRDMSIVDGQRPNGGPSRRSEGGDPVAPRGAGRDKNAPALTRTLGEEHLDVHAASNGLLDRGFETSSQKRVATTAVGLSDGTDAVNADGTDGGNASAADGNPNAGGGNATAAGGNPNVPTYFGSLPPLRVALLRCRKWGNSGE